MYAYVSSMFDGTETHRNSVRATLPNSSRTTDLGYSGRWPHIEKLGSRQDYEELYVEL